MCDRRLYVNPGAGGAGKVLGVPGTQDGRGLQNPWWRRRGAGGQGAFVSTIGKGGIFNQAALERFAQTWKERYYRTIHLTELGPIPAKIAQVAPWLLRSFRPSNGPKEKVAWTGLPQLQAPGLMPGFRGAHFSNARTQHIHSSTAPPRSSPGSDLALEPRSVTRN